MAIDHIIVFSPLFLYQPVQSDMVCQLNINIRGNLGLWLITNAKALELLIRHVFQIYLFVSCGQKASADGKRFIYELVAWLPNT